MNEAQIDWSTLSKKERKKLIKERKRQEIEIKNKRGRIVKWIIIVAILTIFAWGVIWFIKEASKPIPGSGLPNQGRDHVPKEKWGKFKYNSDPPTSGPHDLVWTKAGVYDQSPGEGYLVHSLEHGYVIISYRCDVSSKFKVQSSKLGTESAELEGVEEVEKVEDVDNKTCLEFVEKLKQRVEKDKWKLILIPRPNLDTNFALTAWTRIEKFTTKEANMERVNNFIDSLRSHGPEQTME